MVAGRRLGVQESVVVARRHDLRSAAPMPSTMEGEPGAPSRATTTGGRGVDVELLSAWTPFHQQLRAHCSCRDLEG